MGVVCFKSERKAAAYQFFHQSPVFSLERLVWFQRTFTIFLAAGDQSSEPHDVFVGGRDDAQHLGVKDSAQVVAVRHLPGELRRKYVADFVVCFWHGKDHPEAEENLRVE